MRNYPSSLKKTSSFELPAKALVLVFIKESYFFLRNLYGFVFHPFRTTVKIFAKPDRSQIVLIFGLPAYLWFAGLFLFLPVFWLFRNSYFPRLTLLLFFYFFTLLLFLVALYLLFWVFQYYYQCKVKPKKFT